MLVSFGAEADVILPYVNIHIYTLQVKRRTKLLARKTSYKSRFTLIVCMVIVSTLLQALFPGMFKRRRMYYINICYLYLCIRDF